MSLEHPSLPGIPPAAFMPPKGASGLSGAQERKWRVARGLPRYTPTEAAGRRRLARKKTRERADIIDRLKLEAGCSDCGYNAHPAALDFDHLPGSVKRGNVSRMFREGLTLSVIFAEIAKCEVVCANCHRVRTANRREPGV